jgi:regulator of protease activity HflC (stomatin/prohibitin superfamily)
MARHFLMLHVTVKDGERALLTRNGRLERVLEPGRHRLFDPRSALAAEVSGRSFRISGGAIRGDPCRAA